MKKLLLVLGLCASLQLTAQEFVSSVFLKSYPSSYFVQEFGLFSSFDVDLYRMVYTSKEVDGSPATVSGLVCVPKIKTNGYPLLVYQHGTSGSRPEVPGYLSFESVLPSIFSSLGFIAIAPDYLGLGIDEGIHPYVHAASESWVAAHMLQALPTFLNQQGYNTTRDLFLTGYSQGGHASMALHRSLEKDNLGFDLKAASHMSGPYAISSGMRDLLLSEENYASVAYLPYVALSYNEVYGIFPQNNIRNFFKSEYAALIEQFARGDFDLWSLNSRLSTLLVSQFGKAIPKKMILDDVVAAIISDNNHPVNIALRDNDVFDWKPTIPTRLLYCKADEQVTYQNTIIADNKMKANGSVSVTALDVNTNASHSACVSPAITSTLFFFLAYLELSDTKEEETPLEIYPNPANDYVFIKGGSLSGASLVNASGAVYMPAVADNSIDLSSMPKGMYILMVKFQDGSGKKTKLLIK